MYKAILWDNDGILVHTEKWYYQATKDIMAQSGFDLSIDIYHEMFLKNNSGAWHLIKNLNPCTIKHLKKQRNLLYSQYLKNKDIFLDEVPQILRKLQNQYKMGVVTSSRREHFNIIHKNSNLLQYFDFVIANDDFKNSKPDPEPYLMGIKKSGFKASECLSIEDSERGLNSAKNANLDCWVIPNEMTANGNFTNANRILNSINEIPVYLQ